MHLTADGLVLSARKSDDDRVITILTESHGIVTAFVNGAARTKSTLAASTEIFSFCRFIIFEHKDRFVVDKADLNRAFFGLRKDVEKLALASCFSQLALELCPRDERADGYLQLMLNTLHLLELGEKPLRLLKSALTLRMLSMAGFMPDLVACRDCGCYENPTVRLRPDDGEILCALCDIENDNKNTLAISPGILAAMRHIIYSESKQLFSFSLSEEGLLGLDEIIERYLLLQIDKKLPALDFYKRIRLFQ